MKVEEIQILVAGLISHGPEETYNKMMKSLNNIDLSKVVELVDNTDLSGELACAGGACEVDVDLTKIQSNGVEEEK